MSTVPIPQGATIDQPAASVPIPQGASVDQEGEITNDVGNTVIVPKDGESFSDTMQRAVAQGKQTTQGQIDKEMATAPTKVAETLAAAPAIGAIGTAALAGPNEMAGAVRAAISALIPDILKGGQAIGEWGEAHPMTREILKAALTGAVAGTTAGAMAKTARKVINAAPD